MFVVDLDHYRDLPVDIPAAALRMAENLGRIVRAATATDTVGIWTSALPCQRRPQHRKCAGWTMVDRPASSATIRWRCSVCGDDGVISNWEGSPVDLRRPTELTAAPTITIVVSDEVAATLQDLYVLDVDTERVVYGMRRHRGHTVLTATEEAVDELLGFVAAEANSETNRRRQQRLDAAFETLNAAADGS